MHTLSPYYSVPVVTVKLVAHLDDFSVGNKIGPTVMRQRKAEMCKSFFRLEDNLGAASFCRT